MNPDITPATTGDEVKRANGADEPFTSLDAARLYHAHGLVPIPWRLMNGRKTPVVTHWNDPRRRLSVDRMLPEFAKPRTGVGLVTGRPGGGRIIAVDVDVKGATPGDPKPFLDTASCIAHTPSGGWHFFYADDRDAADPEIETRAGVLPGVDVRADKNGYVAVWPSVGYRWKSGLSSLLAGDLPGFSTVRHLLVKSEATPAAEVPPPEPWIAKALSEPVPIGEQRQTITKLAGYFIKQRMPVDIIIATLWPRVRTWGQRTDEPWTETQVREIAEDLARKDAGRPTSSRIETVTAAALVRRAHERQDDDIWLCEEWLPERGLLLVAGPSHVGKTWLMVDLAVSVATGRSFLGRHTVEQGPVLFVAAEDDAVMLGSRLYQAWIGKTFSASDVAEEVAEDGKSATFFLWPAFPDAPIHLHVGNGLRFGNPASETAFIALAEQLRPRLIILDPLKDLVDGKTTEKFFATFVDRLPRLRQLQREIGCAIALVHHVGKNDERQGTDNAIYGSNLLGASFDTRWLIEEVAGGMAITRKIKRAARPTGVFLRYTIANERLCFTEKEIDEDERAKLKTQNAKDQAILAVLRERGEAGMNDLYRELKNRGVLKSKDTLNGRLQRLQKDGYAVQEPKTKKWKIGLDDSEVS